MPREIAVTFDYRCPFARNGHEAVVNAMRDGADLDVRFLPFSLDQVHVEEGEAPVWERDPSTWGTGVLALCYGIAVRDAFSERFVDAHLALFAARHDHGRKLGHEDVLEEAVASVGLDPAAVKAEAWSGRPLKALAEEHTEAVDRWAVFGVPTFIEGDEAVFVRFMERGRVDDLLRTLDLVGWTRLNEYKRTRIPR
ncbi:MAG: protein-disulfide isomerase [Actinobacteria bacterium]|nr:protein-disulfide isomerase [Actinomycetota bacterium]